MVEVEVEGEIVDFLDLVKRDETWIHKSRMVV